MPEKSWKCSNCGYTLQAEVPPQQCPSCGQTCDFVDASCYIGDCEGSTVDPRIKGK